MGMDVDKMHFAQLRITRACAIVSQGSLAMRTLAARPSITAAKDRVDQELCVKIVADRTDAIVPMEVNYGTGHLLAMICPYLTISFPQELVIPTERVVELPLNAPETTTVRPMPSAVWCEEFPSARMSAKPCDVVRMPSVGRRDMLLNASATAVTTDMQMT